jgi:hypothetical protein
MGGAGDWGGHPTAPLAGAGGTFGGGSGGFAPNTGRMLPGMNGAVRIVWPGDTRLFPSTDVGTP